MFPDKAGREYVLRRIFRRAVRHGQRLGIKEPFMHRVCETVIDEMAGQYPDLRERKSIIAEVTLEEEKRFRATLERGLALLDDEFARMQKAGDKNVSGKAVFTLYDTFGFPRRPHRDHRGRARLTASTGAGFEQEMDKARERSRFSGSDQEAVATELKQLASELGATKFTGYEGRGASGEGSVRAILVDGRARRSTRRSGAKVALVFDQTPFYGESGGQIGDTGMGHDEDREGPRRRHQEAGRRRPRPASARSRSARSAVGEHVHFEVDDGPPRPRSARTTRRPTCSTTRSSACSAATSRRRARWSRPIACASTSRTSRR